MAAILSKQESEIPSGDSKFASILIGACNNKIEENKNENIYNCCMYNEVMSHLHSSYNT